MFTKRVKHVSIGCSSCFPSKKYLPSLKHPPGGLYRPLPPYLFSPTQMCGGPPKTQHTRSVCRGLRGGGKIPLSLLYIIYIERERGIWGGRGG